MGRKKINPLDVKTPYSVGIKKKLAIAFDEKLEELGLNRSNTVESLIKQFLKDLH